VGGVGEQRLRHINDSVLSSLKMEGIRLIFFWGGGRRAAVNRGYGEILQHWRWKNQVHPKHETPLTVSVCQNRNQFLGLCPNQGSEKLRWGF
jgi:hypothetical protein